MNSLSFPLLDSTVLLSDTGTICYLSKKPIINESLLKKNYIHMAANINELFLLNKTGCFISSSTKNKSPKIIPYGQNPAGMTIQSRPKTFYIWTHSGDVYFFLSGRLPLIRIMEAYSAKNVLMMASGLEHTVAVTRSGELYGTGQNDKGQLGLGSGCYIANSVTEIKIPEKAIAVTCGNASTLVVTELGNLYVFGENNYGELGCPVEGFVVNPKKIDLSDIVAVATGCSHSLALNKEGDVFVFGHNQYGQLGIYKSGTETPEKLDSVKNVIGIYCGSYHSIVLTSNGDVFGWGNNENQQLGFTDTERQATPRIIPQLSGKGITLSALKYDLSAVNLSKIAVNLHDRLIRCYENGKVVEKDQQYMLATMDQNSHLRLEPNKNRTRIQNSIKQFHKRIAKKDFRKERKEQTEEFLLFLEEERNTSR